MKTIVIRTSSVAWSNRDERNRQLEEARTLARDRPRTHVIVKNERGHELMRVSNFAWARG